MGVKKESLSADVGVEEKHLLLLYINT